MGYDTITKAPVITLPEGYTIGPMSESYGTFDIMFNGREIGRVAWHSYYYAMYKPNDNVHFSITGYLQREDAQQHAANIIVSMHKTLGDDFSLPFKFKISPNALMTRFIIAIPGYQFGQKNNWNMVNLGFIDYNRINDNWKLYQVYGEGEFEFDNMQEATDTCIKIAKEKAGITDEQQSN